MDSSHRNFADRVLGAKAPPKGLSLGSQPIGGLYGVVKSIQAGTPPTVTVTLAGSTTQVAGVKFFRSYEPIVNDTVFLGQRGSDYIVLGILAATQSPRFSARLYNASHADTITNAAFQVLGFDTVDFDYYKDLTGTAMAVTGVQGGSSSGHFLIPATGLYLFTAQSSIANSDAKAITQSFVFLAKNPSFSTNTITTALSRRGWDGITTAVANNPEIGVAAQLPCTAGDTVYLGMFQNAGVNRTTNPVANGEYAYFECSRIPTL